jgi:hypothetical protein
MLTIAVLALILGGIRFCHYLYYMDLIYATNQLEEVRGITNVHIYGDDDFTYEVNYATFTLVGRPDALIGIRGPAGGVVGTPEHLWLERLGPWEFHEHSYGFNNTYDLSGNPVKSLGYRRWIDIGPSGEYGSMLPVKIRDLNDVVTHYDELVKHLSTWPDEKHWGELPKRPDMQTVYCVSPAGTGSVSPPADFPKD